MREVQAHQKQLDNIRENYTYTSWQLFRTSTATGSEEEETGEYEDFFVNGHVIERKVKRMASPRMSTSSRRKPSG